MINYYIIYILKCAEFSGDQESTIHVSCDLFITEKSVKYIENPLFSLYVKVTRLIINIFLIVLKFRSS